MKQLLLRGFVTPEDFNGSIQTALDQAARLDINKVVLTGNYSVSETLVIPEGMYLVLENVTLHADGANPLLRTRQEENYSFRQKFITIEGHNAKVEGNIHIFNTHHIHISGLDMAGDLTLEYTLWGTLDRISFQRGSLKLGRGCGNFIIQNLRSRTPAYIDGNISCGKVVPGSKPDLQNIILQDSVFETPEPAVHLAAADDCGVMNIQVDHIQAQKTAVLVGQNQNQPAELFFNLTFTDLDAPENVQYQNEVKHVYQK